jgi:peroxiredoxin 5
MITAFFFSGCSKTHLPSYIEKEKELKSSGVDEIVCVSVNDPFVMSAWGNQFEIKGKIRMLADPLAAFTKEVDLSLDLPPLGEFSSFKSSIMRLMTICSSFRWCPQQTLLHGYRERRRQDFER